MRTYERMTTLYPMFYIKMCFVYNIIYIYTYYKCIIDIYTTRSVHCMYYYYIHYTLHYIRFGFDPNFMSDTEEVCVDEMVSDPFHHMYVFTYHAISKSPFRSVLFFISFSSLIIEV